MISRSEFIKDRNKVLDKALGSLSGLAIGDSFGDASRKPDNQQNYGITTDFHKGASWSTDDTEFALLTAKILIDCRGNLASDDVVNAWLTHVATQDELKRGGASEFEASKNLRRGLRPPLSGKYNSYFTSDGAAMRIAPIGIICAGDPEKAAAMAEIDASISHYEDGIWGAQAVAAAVSVAMVDGTIDEIIGAALNAIPSDSWFCYTLNKALEIGNRTGKSLIDSWMPLHDELWASYRATVAEAVSEAFGVLNIVNDTFKNGVIAAGNFGRDADTIGAIVGAILGAKYGASQIPEHWIEKTRYPTGTCLLFTKGIDIREMAEKLADLII